MSGYPSVPTIADLRLQLMIIRRTDNEISDLNARIDSMQAQLGDARATNHQAVAKAKTLMASMDTTAKGNHGYENRMLTLLIELMSQAELHVRLHP